MCIDIYVLRYMCMIRNPHAYPELKLGECACGFLTFQ